MTKVRKTTQDDDETDTEDESPSLSSIRTCFGRHVSFDLSDVREEEILWDDLYGDRDADSEDSGPDSNDSESDSKGRKGRSLASRYEDRVLILCRKATIASKSCGPSTCRAASLLALFELFRDLETTEPRETSARVPENVLLFVLKQSLRSFIELSGDHERESPSRSMFTISPETPVAYEIVFNWVAGFCRATRRSSLIRQALHGVADWVSFPGVAQLVATQVVKQAVTGNNADTWDWWLLVGAQLGSETATTFEKWKTTWLVEHCKEIRAYDVTGDVPALMKLAGRTDPKLFHENIIPILCDYPNRHALAKLLCDVGTESTRHPIFRDNIGKQIFQKLLQAVPRAFVLEAKDFDSDDDLAFALDKSSIYCLSYLDVLDHALVLECHFEALVLLRYSLRPVNSPPAGKWIGLVSFIAIFASLLKERCCAHDFRCIARAFMSSSLRMLASVMVQKNQPLPQDNLCYSGNKLNKKQKKSGNRYGLSCGCSLCAAVDAFLIHPQQAVGRFQETIKFPGSETTKMHKHMMDRIMRHNDFVFEVREDPGPQQHKTFIIHKMHNKTARLAFKREKELESLVESVERLVPGPANDILQEDIAFLLETGRWLQEIHSIHSALILLSHGGKVETVHHKTQPDSSRRGRSKTPCPLFARTGTCHYRDDCWFSHEYNGSGLNPTEIPRMIELPALREPFSLNIGPNHRAAPQPKSILKRTSSFTAGVKRKAESDLSDDE
ncbi:unnamed protein product [Periconia digitata]|uniref:C3H1-type domain-containing protein n=1 Tax=Periconia digitata TaxID=1303443 RepID=A0A9W4XNL1_9PLEO|nr:unnamed protein product [Periconia digitata]